MPTDTRQRTVEAGGSPGGGLDRRDPFDLDSKVSVTLTEEAWPFFKSNPTPSSRFDETNPTPAGWNGTGAASTVGAFQPAR